MPAAPRDLESFLTGTPTVFRFEPQFNLRTGRVAGVESLLCITQSGEARPAPELATDVEAAGLGLDLAERWLREACAERRSWRRQAGQDFPVSVPVSSGILEHPDFLPLVRRVLADNELPSSFLELEIPEHVLAGSEAVRRALGKIHAAGVLICIREFDGSQSNIRSLTFVPLAKLLIDPKLIREAATGTPAAALFDGIIGAARALGILVCASGIDSPALEATAERHGCVLAQGTTFGPRVDSEQFLSLVRGAGVDTATLPPLDLDLIGADGPLSEAQPDPATTR